MIEQLVRETNFVSFDGTVSLVAQHQRPDRFSHLESPDSAAYRIARGGGYSYGAASFGENSLVQEMTCFNRFIEFDPAALTLKLEAGVTLQDLMEWALARELHFPILPGYPLITVGGCVAADVHGKNPYKDGTFSDWVRRVTVYHPEKGYQTCSASQNPELLALTCGGFGLTGIITDVTLQLTRLPGPSIAMSQNNVTGLAEAVDALSCCDADIAYSWHDACAGSNFGRGIVYTGQWSDQSTSTTMNFRPMTASTRMKLPVSAWNNATARAANTALFQMGKYKKSESVVSLLDASFPFASNTYFHRLFGKVGLRETQILVSDDNIHDFCQSLRQLVCDTNAPTMMASLKRFNGRQQSLSMSGSGFVVALDCYRNAETDGFMRELDKIILSLGGQPNLSKDSRVSAEVAQLSIPHFAQFKAQLFDYDQKRIMRSELSARLGLL